MLKKLMLRQKNGFLKKEKQRIYLFILRHDQNQINKFNQRL